MRRTAFATAGGFLLLGVALLIGLAELQAAGAATAGCDPSLLVLCARMPSGVVVPEWTASTVLAATGLALLVTGRRGNRGSMTG